MATNEIKPIIRKVWERSDIKQLLITIPLNNGIEKGDYVIVKKVEVR